MGKVIIQGYPVLVIDRICADRKDTSRNWRSLLPLVRRCEWRSFHENHTHYIDAPKRQCANRRPQNNCESIGYFLGDILDRNRTFAGLGFSWNDHVHGECCGSGKRTHEKEGSIIGLLWSIRREWRCGVFEDRSPLL
jgi:hypothetical protein